MSSEVNSNPKSFVQSFIVVTNVLVCMIMVFQALNCATSSQYIFELSGYPPYLNKMFLTVLLTVFAILAIVLTVFIIKKRMWALNAIVIFYLILLLVEGRAAYFFLSLVLIHAILYFPLRKLYR
jgi:hypothetical protein